MSDRDQLLERLLSGEATPADPAVRALFERDPTAREDYEALRQLEGSLERQGDRVREVVEASQRMPSRVGAEQVLATLTQIAQDAPARELPRRRRLSPVWLALAAGLVAAFAWALWSRSDEPGLEKEILMGSGSAGTSTGLSLTSPIGPVEQYAPFTWKGSPQAGGWFKVAVFDADRPGSEPVTESEELVGTEWSPARPPPTWPANIHWTVTPYDRAGRADSASVVSASASLRR